LADIVQHVTPVEGQHGLAASEILKALGLLASILQRLSLYLIFIDFVESSPGCWPT